ncbi:hypothetical protein EJ04DRAFT_437684 [Polyplosphaeria fusca]|uniref:F-box domain-containing protein n=1 Tax=Polyplosphaeria fusca TaxID=682080 RepID=A0A9P4V2A8_9PLEO|nr:hypothetical protein EJ04DRAFT_437684 [Polyplosphaeria fusca]
MPMALLRFAVFIPFSIYYSIAKNHENVLQKHPELSGIYNPLIARGEPLAAKWGRVGFFWNIAVWVPAIIIIPPFSIIFGPLDIVLAVMLSLATQYQTSYVPHSIDSCRDGGAHAWQRPHGANESFFEASARLNATTTSGFQMCKSYVLEWQYGITLSFFYSLLSFMNVVTSIWIFRRTYRNNRREGKSNLKWVLKGLMEFPKLLGFALLGLAFIPVVLFQFLPKSITSRTRYIRRYAHKTLQRFPTPRDIEMRVFKRRPETRKYANDHLTKGNPLSNFLGVYDIFMLVAPHLHYVDVANLSLVSKSVRDAVLPAQEIAQRTAHLKRYTCRPESRQICWICTKQICKGCEQFRMLDQTPPYHHLDVCHPYCQTCYWHQIRRNRHTNLTKRCRCCPPTTKQNRLQRYWNSEAYNNRTYNLISRSICTMCDKRSNNELLDMREARTRAELKDRDRYAQCKSLGCEKVLGSGPRWWVCKKCGRECISSCHAAWGKSIKVGNAHGVEAV